MDVDDQKQRMASGDDGELENEGVWTWSFDQVLHGSNSFWTSLELGVESMGLKRLQFGTPPPVATANWCPMCAPGTTQASWRR